MAEAASFEDAEKSVDNMIAAMKACGMLVKVR